MLQKSLIVRDPEALMKEKKKQDMSNRVKVSELYDEIREKKTMPNVPLHMMDEISKNLAECLINRTAHERAPYKDWKNQDVMLPILNAENR